MTTQQSERFKPGPVVVRDDNVGLTFRELLLG
jgi:hypothetical protein